VIREQDAASAVVTLLRASDPTDGPARRTA
jgi:hypothetical protein